MNFKALPLSHRDARSLARLASILCLSAALWCSGCGTPSSSSTSGGLTTDSSTGTTGSTAAGGAASTGTGSGGTTAGTTGFDGSRAFTQLQAQCNFGPRPMGTPAHTQCLQWIVAQLTPNVDSPPATQTFSYTNVAHTQTFNVTNIVGRINPTAPTQVLLAAHWDTRPFADSDTVAANQIKPILGADDGASGVAVLLELARVFHANKPSVGIEFVFFDAEDYAPVPKNYDEMYLGAKYFAQHMTDPKTGASWKPAYGVLLDMIGDKNLDIYEDVNSANRAPAVVTKVWGAAAALGYGTSFIPHTKYQVDDDHIPLLDAGVPVADCIDFDYETFDDLSRQYWHTLQDTPDKCSPQSLQIVGNVISKVIYDEH